MAKLQKLFGPKEDFYDYMKSFQSEHWFLELESANKVTKYSYLRGVKEGYVIAEFQYRHDNRWDGTGLGVVMIKFTPLQEEDDEYERVDLYALYSVGSGIEGFEAGAKKFLDIRRAMSKIDEFIPLQEFLSKLEERGIELGMHA
jgi:hypothetical protein